MAVAFVASTTGGTANSTVDTSFTASTPSSTTNDLIICWVNATNGTASAPTITAPAGWTALASPAPVDGSAPQLTANVFYRLVQGGDTSSPVWSFSSGSNATYVMSAYSGADLTTPVTNGSVDPYAGTNTAKTTASVTTSLSGWIVTGFGDRSGGTYSANTDTFRAVSTHVSATVSWLQDSNGNVSAGSQVRTATGPSTSVGTSFILRINPAPTAGSNANADAGSGTGTAYQALPLVSPLKEWMKDKGSMYVAHRGGSADYVEHTMAAYVATDARKVQAMEISTWMTTDGIWLASHDRDTSRMFGAGQSIDIPTNTYAAVMAATAAGTTIGGYPMAKVTDIISAFNDQHIWFIENKQSLNISAFFAMLEAYPNATGRFVIKAFCSTAGPPSSSPVAAGRLRGFRSWGYYYEADVPTLASTSDYFDILGQDYTASVGAWTATLAVGKPVLAHVCLSLAAVNQGFARGSQGVMTGKIATAVPNAPADMPSGTGVAYDATVSTPIQTSAVALTANATGTALDATVYVPPLPIQADGLGEAYDATIEVVEAGDTFYFYTPTRSQRQAGRFGQGARLWRRMSLDVGVSVLRFGSSFQMIEEPSTEQMESADSLYVGGRIYAIDEDEATRLIDAGYGAWVHS